MNRAHKNALRRDVLTMAVLALAGIAWAMPAMARGSVHLRGTIRALTPASLTITTMQGDEKVVAVNGKTRITGVAPADPGQIHAGSYVGIANMDTGHGNLASEVVVFPASMKGAGLGDYPWDVSRAWRQASHGPATAGSSHMTSGTVAAGSPEPGRSMMTNGTVAHMTTSARMTLGVDYGHGTKRIVVAPGTPIVRVAHADKSDLKVGTAVFVAAAPKPGTSTLVARFIVVGLEGAVPPM